MTLHHQVHGPDDGIPIVFLHGLGTSSWMWDDQVGSLSREHRCVTVDLPGCGASRTIPWTSMRDAADRVATVIDRVGGTAHVVGLSLGAYVALVLLAEHPARVTSLVVSGVSTAPLRPAWLWRAGVAALAPIITSGPVAGASARAMQLPDDARTTYRREMADLRQSTIRRIYDEVIDFTPSPALAQRTQPVLAVAGGKEMGAILAGLETLPAVSPHAVAAIAPDLRHAWNSEDPDLFTAMIVSWTTSATLPDGLDPVAAGRPVTIERPPG